MLSYFLLPRPHDSAKVLFVLVPASLAWLTTPTPHRWSVLQVAGFVLAFECLVYHARYLWNDLRGLSEDRRHPQAWRRRRLPPREGTRRLIVAALFVRLALAAAVAGLLDARLARGFAWSAIGVWITAVIYETLRSKIGSAIGHPATLTGWKIGLYVLVGSGYGLRAAVGCWLGAGGDVDPGAITIIAATASALGAMNVTMVWVLEGTAFVGSKRLGQPAGYEQGLHHKAHLGPLLAQAGLLATDDHAVHLVNDRSSEPVLLPPRAVTTVWNIALLVAAGGAAIVGLVLANHLDTGGLSAPRVLLAVAIGTAAAAVTAGARRLSTAATAIVLAIMAITVLAAASPLTSLIASLPLTVTLLVYLVLRRASYSQLLLPPRDPQ